MKLRDVFEKAPEGYAAFVEELPGANTEAAALMLEANRQAAEESRAGGDIIRKPFSVPFSWSAGMFSRD